MSVTRGCCEADESKEEWEEVSERFSGGAVFAADKGVCMESRKDDDADSPASERVIDEAVAVLEERRVTASCLATESRRDRSESMR